MDNMKRCNTCLVIKPLNEFHKHPLVGTHPSCKICRNTKNRMRKFLLSDEQKKQRRINKKESHQRAKEKYKNRLKLEKLENEVRQNKLLYEVITSDSSILTIKEITQKYDISTRFYKRLLKYRGNCYKTETVIDRIKPKLDDYFQEIGIREKTFDWLINTTGYKLKIDIFYLKSNIAVEYNGLQHYQEIGYGNLEEVQLRDKIKSSLLKSNGIQLLVFTSEEEIDIFIQNPEKGRK
jgi:hypothetical protein